jgi:murein DD-endopeptidase MepM/ murein hydrolase activator NlpD
MSSVVESVRSWPWLRFLALAVIASSAAACSSEAVRFNSNPYASQHASNETTSSVPQRAPAGSVQTSALPPPQGSHQGSQYAASQPLPPPTTGVSGGGRGMASYHPNQSADQVTTGSVRAQARAEPAKASPKAAPAAGSHLVAPGETLTRVARTYNMSITELARLNSIPPHTKLKVGDRLKIPAGRTARAVPAAQPKALSAPAPSKAEAKAKAQPKSLPRAASPQQPELASVATPQSEPPTTNVVRASHGGMSFRWPAKGRIIAGFGPRTNGQTNDGINIALPEGTPIKAAEDGVVAYAGNELKGYGNLVLVRHADGYVTAYAHAKELLVKRGDPIKRGQTIARSGQTGNVDAPQLHFEIRKGPSPIDPMPHLSGG